MTNVGDRVEFIGKTGIAFTGTVERRGPLVLRGREMDCYLVRTDEDPDLVLGVSVDDPRLRVGGSA